MSSEESRFHRDLLQVLTSILRELRKSNELRREANDISRETNSKFDDEDIKLSEQVDEAIQQNRDINLGLKELNRSVEE